MRFLAILIQHIQMILEDYPRGFLVENRLDVFDAYGMKIAFGHLGSEGLIHGFDRDIHSCPQPLDEFFYRTSLPALTTEPDWESDYDSTYIFFIYKARNFRYCIIYTLICKRLKPAG